ncbi:hypothetical protein Hypma_003945 [Hypsizygus marmoreus]|uniref:F-box domain-containing protein n=1 Tax=Hypsizygus marmoreus TaxID=39966 RepID=A0A369J529_HYPMA|nr:hypothetical protein Hypma_003945 [Hypsizygus marmoreus]
MENHSTEATLLTLPLEILDAIAFALTSLQSLGPPSILLPLLLTCKHTHALLSPSSNPGLHARIFRHKFDSAPVRRRAFTPTPQQYVDQLVRYCTALKVLRRGSVYVGCVGDVWGVRGERDEEGMGWGVGSLGEALMVGVVMMMEDEGRNVRQLVQWAGADGFVDGYVRGRLYDGAHGNNGWPVENEENACALWLMWLLTTEERLYNETPAERQQMLELLQPIVTMPYRYPVGEIPPQHYTLPLPSSSSQLPPQQTTIPTLHGPYPPYPSPTTRLISRSYYSTRPVLSTPLISSAARLLYFARTEVVPLGIPQHFARDRREAWAQGRKELGPTREDVEEFNWGWMVRLPLGRGVWTGNGVKGNDGRVGWRWGVGDISPFYALNDDDDDDDDTDLTTISVAPGPSPFPNPHPPHPRWAGKAPHSKSLSAPHRSRKWDADWWRLRLCGDPARRQPRVPIGRVYEPGCMDGLWQGLMMTPSEASIQALLNTALHPPHGTEFTERTMTRPVYMRLSELHGVFEGLASSSSSSSPSSTTSSSSTPSSSRSRKRHHRRRGNPHTPTDEAQQHPFAHVHDGEGEGMNNAWFAGARPPTVRAREDGLIELEVRGVGTGVHRRWMGGGVGGGGGGGRLGNDAFPTLDSGSTSSSLAQNQNQNQNDEEEGEGEEPHEFEGYEHDYARCTRCRERRRLMKRVRARQARIRERAFGGVGLGMHGDGGSGSSRSTSASSAGGSSDEDMDVDTDEEDLDEWDEDADGDGAGRAHDVLKRVPPLRFGDGDRERCDGVREIVLVGETDPTHSHAFNPYTFHGRIRPYDGLIGILRSPHPNPRAHFSSSSQLSPHAAPYPYPDVHIGQEGQGGEGLLFYGYLVGGDNFVGSWRVVGEDMGAGTPVWEGAFCLGRRED